MIQYSKLDWISDSMSYERGYKEEFIVSHYLIKDFPTVNLYIDTTNNKLLEAFIDDEF